ncbi:18110_t:CDS:2, partial [Funneliformis geosporum]
LRGMMDGPLAGFKPCNGDYPVTLTLMTMSPDPIVLGQNITVHTVGQTTEVIEEGALMRIYHEPNGKPEFESDYCKLFVEPSGFVCPVEKGNFDFTATWLIEHKHSEPKTMEDMGKMMHTKITLSNPDEKVLLCIEGMLQHPMK